MKEIKKIKVLIVGGGASGCSAAYSLALNPDKFDVTLYEASTHLGGVATSESLNLPDGSTVRINDGVQGGVTSYRNTLALHKALGLADPHPVEMIVTFGKGEFAWSNIGNPTELVKKLQVEIKKFESALKWINRFSFVFAFVPIRTVLKWWGFSKEFGERMVYPLTALFFGTGNQTPNVSAAIIARVFLDPQLRLFDYCPDRLLSQAPSMFAFSLLGDIYSSIGENLSLLGVRVCLSRKLTSIVRKRKSCFSGTEVIATDSAGVVESFDKIILACDAATALKLLDSPSYWERSVLGSVRYYHDVTITHGDTAYMKDHYELDLGDNDEKQDRRSDYFIYTNDENPSKLEMSFDLGHYQPHLRSRPPDSFPIYQTIFLDREGCEKTWTIDRIAPEKIVLKKWWRQFSHEASHFRNVVPFVFMIQGSGNGTTFYAGSWTLVNTHEIATISGLAAAYRLGAAYPFGDDLLAASQFDTYLALAHARFRSCCGL